MLLFHWPLWALSYLLYLFDQKAGIFSFQLCQVDLPWYDNEFGYSTRVADLLEHVAKNQLSVNYKLFYSWLNWRNEDINA